MTTVVTTTSPADEPRMANAINELTGLILRSYPDTTFTTAVDEDGRTVFVTAEVDVDDPDEVVDCFIDRALTLQVDEGIPLHVIPLRTPERRAKLAAAMRLPRRQRIDPSTAVG